MARAIRAAAVLMAAALGCSACGAARGSGTFDRNATPKRGGTVYVLGATAYSHLDPAQGWDGGVNNFYRLIYRTLTTVKSAPGTAGNTIVPDLATDTGRPSDGDRTWTFTLKKGLKFQNGKPITSRDLRWGISRAWDPVIGIGSPYAKELIKAPKNYKGPYLSGELTTIGIPDDRTIVFHLVRPYADFTSVAAQVNFTPFPVGTGAGHTFDTTPIASGPYEVSEFEPGTSIRLSRNPYWDRSTDKVRRAAPDHFDFEFGLDPATIDARMVAGLGQDVNAIGPSVQPATVPRLDDPQIKRRTYSGLNGCTTYLGMNNAKGPFRDKRLREAVAYAIDKTSIVNAYGGSQLAEPAPTIEPPTVNGRRIYHLYSRPGGHGDIAKAEKLLAEAGKPHGFTFTLDNSSSVPTTAAALALQQSLARVGIKMKINNIDASVFYQVIETPAKAHQATITGWCPDWGAGIAFLPPILDGRNITPQGNQNVAQFKNKAIEKDIDRIEALSDPHQQNVEFGKLDKTIMEQVPIVPLIYAKVAEPVGVNIAGAFPHVNYSAGFDLVSVGLRDPSRRAG